jgi:hypothetical protein
MKNSDKSYALMIESGFNDGEIEEWDKRPSQTVKTASTVPQTEEIQSETPDNTGEHAPNKQVASSAEGMLSIVQSGLQRTSTHTVETAERYQGHSYGQLGSMSTERLASIGLARATHVITYTLSFVNYFSVNYCHKVLYFS